MRSRKEIIEVRCDNGIGTLGDQCTSVVEVVEGNLAAGLKDWHEVQLSTGGETYELYDFCPKCIITNGGAGADVDPFTHHEAPTVWMMIRRGLVQQEIDCVGVCHQPEGKAG